MIKNIKSKLTSITLFSFAILVGGGGGGLVLSLASSSCNKNNKGKELKLTSGITYPFGLNGFQYKTILKSNQECYWEWTSWTSTKDKEFVIYWSDPSDPVVNFCLMDDHSDSIFAWARGY